MSRSSTISGSWWLRAAVDDELATLQHQQDQLELARRKEQRGDQKRQQQQQQQQKKKSTSAAAAPPRKGAVSLLLAAAASSSAPSSAPSSAAAADDADDDKPATLEEFVWRRRSARGRTAPAPSARPKPAFQYTLQKLDELAAKDPLGCLKESVTPRYCPNPFMGDFGGLRDDWKDLPKSLWPDFSVPARRAERKRRQLENMILGAAMLLPPGGVCIEFCSGAGHVGLPLAWLRKDCTVLLVDRNEHALAIAKKRIAAVPGGAMPNVDVRCCDVDLVGNEPFDLGIALHACGPASDIALHKCVSQGASFLVCPCCVGKVCSTASPGPLLGPADVSLSSKAATKEATKGPEEQRLMPSTGGRLAYPRSETFKSILTQTDFDLLAAAADFSYTAKNRLLSSGFTVRERARRRCKSLLEQDRLRRAVEAGYETRMCMMVPRDASPKNDMLFGVPGPRQHDLEKLMAPYQEAPPVDAEWLPEASKGERV
eukprot:g6550.t1